MKRFVRMKREPWLLSSLGLIISLVLSISFIFVGLVAVSSEGTNFIFSIFVVLGLALFVLFFRGAWLMMGGRPVYLFSIDQEQIIWGRLGDEKSAKLTEVKSISWQEHDGFQLTILLKNGKRIWQTYADMTIGHKSRSVLLEFLKKELPHVSLEGDLR